MYVCNVPVSAAREQSQCGNSYLGIRKGHLQAAQLRHAAFFIDICFGAIGCHAAVGNEFLFRRKALPGMREVRENEDNTDPNKNGDCAFNDVQPLNGLVNIGVEREEDEDFSPARQPSQDYHLVHSECRRQSNYQKPQRAEKLSKRWPCGS